MERLAALGIAILIASLCDASPQEMLATVIAEDRQVGIGAITGGQFGPGSFSINVPGQDSPVQMPVYDNVNDNNGRNKGNTQPMRTQGKGGEGGHGGGQIVIGTIVMPTKKRRHQNGNNNKKRVSNDALDTIFASTGGNNADPDPEDGFDSSGDQQGNIQIGSITGGNFEQESSSNNNKRPIGAIRPNKDSALNSGQTRHHTVENGALYTLGHGESSNGGPKAGNDYGTSQINVGYVQKEEPWIW